MTLQEYVEQLQVFIERDPSRKDLTVVYSRDDEGNGFQEVYFAPSVGIFVEREFYSHPEDLEDYLEDGLEINAVCIN